MALTMCRLARVFHPNSATLRQVRTPQVLVVDDESFSQLALTTLLAETNTKNKYNIVLASSGQEALGQISDHDFALILLVADMPGLDAAETVEVIRTHPRSSTVPIILIAAHHIDESSRLAAYRKGAVDFLSAPLNSEILHAKVAVFVELARKRLQERLLEEALVRLNNKLQEQHQLDLKYINERKQAEEALRQSQQELRQLASYQDRIKEDERKRIAREIHDEVGQNLLALRIDVSMLNARTSSTHPKLNKKVYAVLERIDATMKAMRSIINNLRPAVLDLGLHAAIEWQVKEFQRRTGIACQLHMPEKELKLDDARATALFRILQESLNNVLRHAQAAQVKIDLDQKDGVLSMRIADNGIGLFPGCRRKANSFGLIGIKERINALGGKFVLDTRKNTGTTLSVYIPLADKETAALQKINQQVDEHLELSQLYENRDVLELPLETTVAVQQRNQPDDKIAGIV
jgi:signal transduction histidine kinase